MGETCVSILTNDARNPSKRLSAYRLSSCARFEAVTSSRLGLICQRCPAWCAEAHALVVGVKFDWVLLVAAKNSAHVTTASETAKLKGF